MSQQMTRQRINQMKDCQESCFRDQVKCEGETKSTQQIMTFQDLIRTKTMKNFDLIRKKNNDFKRFDMIAETNREIAKKLRGSEHVVKEDLDYYYEQLESGPKGYSSQTVGDFTDICHKNGKNKVSSKSNTYASSNKPILKGKYIN